MLIKILIAVHLKHSSFLPWPDARPKSNDLVHAISWQCMLGLYDMCYVCILSVFIPTVIILSVITLSTIILIVSMLSVVMLSIVKLNVVILSVIIIW